MIVTLSPATDGKKKLKVAIIDKNKKQKTIQFGSRGSSDFTIHHDKERKERYIRRHQPRENWDDPFTAGFWSKHLLWNKNSLLSSVKDTEKKYKMNINII